MRYNSDICLKNLHQSWSWNFPHIKLEQYPLKINIQAINPFLKLPWPFTIPTTLHSSLTVILNIVQNEMLHQAVYFHVSFHMTALRETLATQLTLVGLFPSVNVHVDF